MLAEGRGALRVVHVVRIFIEKVLRCRAAFRGAALLGVAASVCIGEALAQPSSPFLFVDVTSSRGIGAYTATDGIGAGVAAAVFDADGDVDLFVPNGAGVADQL